MHAFNADVTVLSGRDHRCNEKHVINSTSCTGSVKALFDRVNSTSGKLWRILVSRASILLVSGGDRMIVAVLSRTLFHEILQTWWGHFPPRFWHGQLRDKRPRRTADHNILTIFSTLSYKRLGGQFSLRKII